ncbi:hypothetical protein [Thermococcus sp.]
MQQLIVSLGRFFSGRLRKLVEGVAEQVEVLENALVFPEAVSAEYGVFKAGSSVLIGPRFGARGSTYYTSGWLFNTIRKFHPKNTITSAELPLKPASYRLELDVPGSGVLELPGYRLQNGVLLLYITPSYRFMFFQDVLTAGWLEDYAQLSITPLETGFRGRLDIHLSEAEYVEVVIKGAKVEDQIFMGDKSEEFTYEFLKEPFLVISHEKLLDPPKLQKALNLVSIVSGHGKFKLCMRVGKAEEEMEFLVELGGE